VVAILIGVMSEMLVGAIEPVAHRLGLTQVFVGVILVALVGNAGEHSTAVLMAMKNKMDLTLGIAVGSSTQIALLVTPLLVFASYGFVAPLDLIFTPFEVAAVTMSVLIVGFVSMDRESHWMEGVMLVGVYVMLAIAFYFFADLMATFYPCRLSLSHPTDFSTPHPPSLFLDLIRFLPRMPLAGYSYEPPLLIGSVCAAFSRDPCSLALRVLLSG